MKASPSLSSVAPASSAHPYLQSSPPSSERKSFAPARAASSREPTARDASAETVIAVPIAMAKVAATPAQNRPWLSANTRTRIAPEHGLMPTEKTTAAILRHDSCPATSFAPTTCPHASPCSWPWS